MDYPKVFFLIGFFTIQLNLKAQSVDTVQVNRLNRQAAQAYLQEPFKTQEIAKEALQLAQKISYSRGIAEAYYNQSLVLKLKGKYEEEMKLHLATLKIYQDLKDSLNIAKIYVAIGGVHNQVAYLGDATLRKKALEYYQKALKIYRSHKNLAGEAIIFRRIGNDFLEEKNYQEAISNYQKALQIEQTLNNEEGIANVQNNLGVAYFEQKLYPQAMDYYQKSLKTILKINNINRLTAAYHNIGQVYLAQNQVYKALELAQKSLEITEKNQMLLGSREAYSLLSDCYTQKGEFEKALNYYKKFKQISDSVWSYESVSKISHIQNLYESQNQAQQLKILQQEKAIANFWFYGGLTFISILLIVSTLIIYTQYGKIKKNRKILAQKESLYQIQQALKESELQNEALKNNQLRENIEFKNKELTTYTLNFAQKNSLIQEVKQGMQEIIKQDHSFSFALRKRIGQK